MLVAAKLGDEVFKRIGQPAIVGEILGLGLAAFAANIGLAALIGAFLDLVGVGMVPRGEVGMAVLTTLAAPFGLRRLSRSESS